MTHLHTPDATDDDIWGCVFPASERSASHSTLVGLCGQSGTGKTYTMEGLVRRMVDLHISAGRKVEARVATLANGHLKDLVGVRKTRGRSTTTLRTPSAGTSAGAGTPSRAVEKAKPLRAMLGEYEACVLYDPKTEGDVEVVLDKALERYAAVVAKRPTARTALNAHSSRAHMLVQIVSTACHPEGRG